LNNDEKVYLNYWFNNLKNRYISRNELPKDGLLIERILYYQYIPFWINFEGDIVDSYSIESVKNYFKQIVDEWFTWLNMDIHVILYGVRYSESIKHQITDLNTYPLEDWQKIEFQGTGFIDDPWGNDCSYFNFDGSYKHRSLLDTIHSECDKFVKENVNHHSTVFSIKGGSWTAHGQPQYIRVNDHAYKFKSVCVHEFGHSLGLDDLYDNVKYPPNIDGHFKSNINSIMRNTSHVTDMDKAQMLKMIELFI
jgi:hypothetical protein